MKIVYIIGGLGNQMFQYALTIALRERFHEDIYVDATSFASYGRHNGLELERVFGIKLLHAPIEEIKRLACYSRYYKLRRIIKKFYRRKPTICNEFPLSRFDRNKLYETGDMYYEGYWQHHAYFDEYKDIIKSEFQFQGTLSKEAESIREKILSENSVAIHIRRGDYLKIKLYQGLCSLDYYKSAVDHFYAKESAPHFFIFSNDIEWCRDNLTSMLGNYTIVDCHGGADSYKDMWLMSMCKHMILANSSFSWWAAYLNSNNGDIIAPEKWINDESMYHVQMPEWILK